MMKGVFMKKIFSTALLVGSFMLVAACGTKPVETPPPPAQTTTTDTNAVGDATSTTDETATQGPTGELLSKRIVYFDYDSAEIRSDSQSVVAAHSRYLAGAAGQKIRLEGHADERGSREYNIGLGERRAQAVRRALLLQGVAEVQLSTVSYGEERPAEAGSTEQAYAANRRVEIVYLK